MPNKDYPSIYFWFEDQNLRKKTNVTVVEIISKLDNNFLHGQRFSHSSDFPLETRKKWYKSITNQTSMPSQARSLISLPFFLRLLFCFIPVKRAIVLFSDHDSRWKFVWQFFLKLTKRCPRQKRGRGGNCTRRRHIFNLVGEMINSTDEKYSGGGEGGETTLESRI